MKAPDLLAKAKKHMDDRAATYDQPGGERSMERTVNAFNIMTGRVGSARLSESEGWLLMQILKDVRDRQRPNAHQDSLEDCVAYAALKAEARFKESAQKENAYTGSVTNTQLGTPLMSSIAAEVIAAGGTFALKT